MSFKPFETSGREAGRDERRGIMGAQFAVVMTAAALSAFVIGWLLVTDRTQLAPLATSPAQLRALAEAGQYPLATAAQAAGREALATEASFHLLASLTLVALSLFYGLWRGFRSPRIRGWSNIFWLVSIAAVVLASYLAPGFTTRKLDLLLLIPGGSLIDVFLLRGVVGAVGATFALLLGHDLGYRLREALLDYDLIATEEERAWRRAAASSTGGGASRVSQARGQGEAPAGGDGFGQRAAPPQAISAEDRARLLLGVGAAASERDIEHAYRTRMKRAHPDHGGSIESAMALNAARDLLLRKR